VNGAVAKQFAERKRIEERRKQRVAKLMGSQRKRATRRQKMMTERRI
jgi:hypothetical protein